MNQLPLKITTAWESTNAAGGALAAALHALRVESVETPQHLRVPSRRMQEQDQLGEVLLLVAEARQSMANAALQLSQIESAVQQQLATR
jgi:hypothetical protein